MKELLEKIGQTGLLLDIVDGKLKLYSDGGQIDPEILNAIKIKRDEITAYLIQNHLGSISKIQYKSIPLIPSNESYLISDAQRRLWVLSQFDEGSVAYNMPSSLYLDKDIDVDCFAQAIESTLERHEMLRTVFKADETGEIKQWILKREDLDFKIDYKDFRKEKNKEEKVKEYIREDSHKTFDLEKGPLLRAALLQIEDKKYVFYFNMHHIISDGWSMDILSKDVFSYYAAYKENKEPGLKELRIQYKDYSAWQLAQLEEESFKTHKAFWLESLKGELPLLDLPGIKQRPKIKTYNGHGLSTYIDSATTGKLREYSQENGGSLFMGLLATWNILMYFYSSQKDIIIGTPVAGRDHMDLEDQIGFYINTLALRNQVNPDQSFNEFYKEVRTLTLASYAHQSYPFDRLVDELHLQRDAGRSVVFDMSITYHNISEATEIGMPDTKVINQVSSSGPSLIRFDIELHFQEVGDCLSFNLIYNEDLYDNEILEGLMNHYKRLLNLVLSHTEEKISQIDYLSEAEQHELLYDFNDTKTDYPRNKTIVTLFEEQVTKTPDNVAIVFEEKTLTYRELDEKANRLARHLRENYGVTAEDLIGIQLHRNEWLIISVLGILKSGGAYVPIDSEYPPSRKEYIIKDTCLKLLITEASFIYDMDYYEGNVFAIDVEFETLGCSSEVLNVATTPNNLAYVMYTSGSTGTPKGVMVEQRSVVRLVKNTTIYSFSSADKLLSTGAIAFDATTFEYWGPLLNGGRLVLCPQGTLLDNKLLDEQIKNKSINIMWFTAGWLNQLVDSDITMFGELKTVVVGGDKLSPRHISKLRNAYPGLEIINGYGPTEGTTFSITHNISEVTGDILLGKPISNSTAYILNENNFLQPAGVVGELCIGGDGLARGYLNQEELTRQKFIKNPFKEGERLYKTGDLGRWLLNGNIEFVGRKDDQVKIRGYRIELGEIEQAILKGERIEEAVVLAKENQNNEKELVAYITAKEPQNISDLRSHLKEILPEYMLPAYYVQLGELPLTSNGKIDKKALPDPQGLSLVSGIEYVAPRNETEEKFVEIWSEILGIEKETIGINDRFFDLGGDSIKVLRMMSVLRKKMNCQLSVAEMYNHETIEKIVVYISENKKEIDVKNKERGEREREARNEIEALKERILLTQEISDKENIEDIYPMSDIEKGMVFAYVMNEGTGTYHDQMVFQKSFFQFNPERFKKSLALLTEKHSILRTSFNLSDYECGIQIVYRKIEIDFNYKDISDLSTEDQEGLLKTYLKSERDRGFVVSNSPLWRMSAFMLGGNNCVFIFQFHHAIIDGWSNASFITELNNLYLKLGEDIHYKPAILKSSYKDFIVHHEMDKKDADISSFWQKELSGYQRLDLLTDQEDLKRFTYSNDQAYLKRVESVAKSLNTTVKVISLSAYLYMLKVLNYNTEIVSGLITNTRPNIEDGDKILGCFLNSIPLRVQVDGTISCSDFIRNIDKKLVELKSNERLSTLEISFATKEKPGLSNPFFDVFFNYVDFHAYQDVAESDSKERNNSAEAGSRINVASHDRTNTFFDFAINTTGGTYTLMLSATKKLKSGLSLVDVGTLYFKIVDSILTGTDKLVKNIDYLSANEKHELLEGLNATKVDYAHKTVMALFEEQALKTPGKTALEFGEERMNYKELNERSNALAHILKEKYQVSSATKVGVMLERSLESVVAMIGVMKTGACYVPIDHDYPTERVTYIVEDSALNVIVSAEDLCKKHGIKVKSHVDIKKLALEKGKKRNLKTTNGLADGAYVIYTSGSTGKPKGVLQTHRMMSNLIQWDIHHSGIAPGLKHLQYASFSFDASLHDLYFVLSSGGSAYVVKESSRLDYSILKEEIIRNEIEVLSMPFSALNAFCLETGIENLENHKIKYIVSTAEQLYVNDRLQKFLEKNPKVELHNHYGPSETHVVTSYKMSSALGNIESRAPIGKPVSNSWIYILDHYQNLVPMGVEGELYIGGDNLATGYLNKEDLTRERFIDNPFGKGKLYKTGDHGYWRPDGNIEFIGRKDDQVKIRGYRIELGEIEQALQRHNEIEEAIVLTNKNQNKETELVAYIISKKEQNTSDLRAYLKTILPDYMLPTHYVQLESLPLTANGKIDKKSLPGWEDSGLASGIEYLAPTNEIEEKLVKIWEEVLQKEGIGIKDDFFVLAGNSLKVMRMINQISKQFNLKYDLKGAYTESTIELMAQRIKVDSWFKESKIENENDYKEIKI